MRPVLGNTLAGYTPYLPPDLNLYAQVFDAADPVATALIDVRSGRVDTSYGALQQMADRVAAGLQARGVRQGDRVGVLFGQDPWCAASHLGAWKIGAISVPLFKLFGPDALHSRLSDAEPAVILSDSPNKIAHFPCAHPKDFSTGISLQSATTPETPAILIYTSGTTGKPKGALHGHKILTGHLPGVEMSHNFLGQPGDVLWTPADWAWIGGLFDVLMPGLALGVPVVIGRGDKFSGENFVATITDSGARNLFLPPTALRMLKADGVTISGLRSVASGGEPLGAEMLDWGRRSLGVTINEFYGQTECNMVASSCSVAFAPRPGHIGQAAPGCEVAVIDTDGLPTGAEGDIAVRRGAASMMLGYWQNPQATDAKFRGDWMLTGDRGVLDQGSLRFVARDDDVITSAGYRIGPAEIEDCLLTHPAVATCGVVGLPDDLRTEIVAAFVVLKPDAAATEADLQDWVRARLAAHCYPRRVILTDALPMTVTGKVIRRELRSLGTQMLEQEGRP